MLHHHVPWDGSLDWPPSGWPNDSTEDMEWKSGGMCNSFYVLKRRMPYYLFCATWNRWNWNIKAKRRHKCIHIKRCSHTEQHRQSCFFKCWVEETIVPLGTAHCCGISIPTPCYVEKAAISCFVETHTHTHTLKHKHIHTHTPTSTVSLIYSSNPKPTMHDSNLLLCCNHVQILSQ